MILDTCALLWLAQGSNRLSRAARAAIERDPFVYISAVSGFEIGYKVAKGTLDLPAPTDEWLRVIIDQHGLTVLGLDLPVCLAAAQLPPFHQDPCDRFIIATAKLNDLPVVTADERFEAYGVKTLL